MPPNADLTSMKLAVMEARKAYYEGSYPIGAVLVFPNGSTLADHNRVYTEDGAQHHAELRLLEKAAKRLMDTNFAAQCTLYTTMEPCIMCTGACFYHGVGKVVFLKRDNRNIGGTEVTDILREKEKEKSIGRRVPLVEQFFAPELLSEVENMWNNWELNSKETKEAAKNRARKLKASLPVGTYTSAVERLTKRPKIDHPGVPERTDETRQK